MTRRVHHRVIGRAPGSPRRCGGLTLVEAVVSLLLTAVLLVAALNTVTGARAVQVRTQEQTRGGLLASQLMSEILARRYEEPDDAVSFGRESGESGGTRSAWDDVDDYEGWSASPPQDRLGNAIDGFEGWTRSVGVDRVEPSDLQLVSGSETGVKRITVTVRRGDRVVAELRAIRTAGWPEESASLRALMVVTDPDAPTAGELTRKKLLESWGFMVTLIDDAASQTQIDTAAEDHDAIYISLEADAAAVGAKLRESAIGVVNEDAELVDDLGLSTTISGILTESEVSILDDTHGVTELLGVGAMPVVSSPTELLYMNSVLASGVIVLGRTGLDLDALVVLETGAERADGTASPARRVQLPWGGAGFDINLLNDNGRALLKQAIEWAANKVTY